MLEVNVNRRSRNTNVFRSIMSLGSLENKNTFSDAVVGCELKTLFMVVG